MGGAFELGDHSLFHGGTLIGIVITISLIVVLCICCCVCCLINHFLSMALIKILYACGCSCLLTCIQPNKKENKQNSKINHYNTPISELHKMRIKTQDDDDSNYAMESDSLLTIKENIIIRNHVIPHDETIELSTNSNKYNKSERSYSSRSSHPSHKQRENKYPPRRHSNSSHHLSDSGIQSNIKKKKTRKHNNEVNSISDYTIDDKIRVTKFKNPLFYNKYEKTQSNTSKRSLSLASNRTVNSNSVYDLKHRYNSTEKDTHSSYGESESITHLNDINNYEEEEMLGETVIEEEEDLKIDNISQNKKPSQTRASIEMEPKEVAKINYANNRARLSKKYLKSTLSPTLMSEEPCNIKVFSIDTNNSNNSSDYQNRPKFRNMNKKYSNPPPPVPKRKPPPLPPRKNNNTYTPKKRTSIFNYFFGKEQKQDSTDTNDESKQDLDNISVKVDSETEKGVIIDRVHTPKSEGSIVFENEDISSSNDSDNENNSKTHPQTTFNTNNNNNKINIKKHSRTNAVSNPDDIRNIQNIIHPIKQFAPNTLQNSRGTVRHKRSEILSLKTQTKIEYEIKDEIIHKSQLSLHDDDINDDEYNSNDNDYLNLLSKGVPLPLKLASKKKTNSNELLNVNSIKHNKNKSNRNSYNRRNSFNNLTLDSNISCSNNLTYNAYNSKLGLSPKSKYSSMTSEFNPSMFQPDSGIYEEYSNYDSVDIVSQNYNNANDNDTVSVTKSQPY